jgi:hypothetical protein
MESTAQIASSSESWMVMIASETFHTLSPRTRVNNPLEYVPRLRAGKIKLIRAA